jgi:hypothetical protein
VNRHAPIFLLVLSAFLSVLSAGCGRDIASYYPEWEKSRWERLDLFRHVEALAIAPVEIGDRIDLASLHYVDMIDRAVFDQTMRRQRFRLVEPEKYAEALRSVKGQPAPQPAIAKADPSKSKPVERTRDSEKDIISAAAKSGADAVLYVRVDEIDPYYPPRLVLRARVYMTKQVSLSEKAIIDMTDDGVPIEVPRSLRERFVWQRDLVLDAHDDGTMALVKEFARRHQTSYRAFGPEIFVRSMERYTDFAGAVIAGQLFNDAVFYKTIDSYNKGLKARGLAPRNPTAQPEE